MNAFLFGCFGGLMVNVFRLFLLSLEPKKEQPTFNWIYLSQFAGLALAGGVLALAHHLTQPITPIVAVNLGMSLPALAKATTSTLQATTKRNTRIQ
jgi:hypothetical protein